jgi:rhodanese-related sulfurtransferase
MTKPANSIEEQLSKPNLLIIDSRASEEIAFNEDFIGAKRIPVQDIANKLDEFGEDKSRPIIVYYGSGSRTSHAEKILRESGYTDVMSTTNSAVLRPAIQKWRVLHG